MKSRGKVIFLEWNSYGNEDMIVAFTASHIDVTCIPFDKVKDVCDADYLDSLFDMLASPADKFDFVFSFNYFPAISNICYKAGVRYVSWVYDSPYVSLYSCTLINPTNCVFLFDREEYLFFHNNGIETVYYLPLAANPVRLTQNDSGKKIFDVSFVGSLYTEEKNDLWGRMARNLPDDIKMQLTELMDRQTSAYTHNFIEESLTQAQLLAMYQAYPLDVRKDGVETTAYLYAQYVLNRHITAMERVNYLTTLGNSFSVHLFTHTNTIFATNTNIAADGVSGSISDSVSNGVINHGPVDYYNTMPSVFRSSKINLNITLRSIHTGVPLRVFDIVGCQGFTLTNYQPDLDEIFEAGREIVTFTCAEELNDKCAYYLANESKRMTIASNGYKRLCAEHTFEKRAERILKILGV